MTHYRCVPCRTRMRVDAPCPVCGGPCGRVRDLAEIVGFRAADPNERLIEEIRNALASRPPAGPGAT